MLLKIAGKPGEPELVLVGGPGGDGGMLATMPVMPKEIVRFQS